MVSKNITQPNNKPEIKNEKKNTGALDEKGNPYPMDNPEGGDPICPDGYKIDNQFDPFDPINPLFRCIPTLKDPTDGIAGKILKMSNNPSSGIQNMVMGNLPVLGGRRRSKTIRRKKRNGIINTHRNHRRSHRRNHRRS